MLIEYVGTKRLPLVLNTPIPFVSRSEISGELQFNPTCEVPDPAWAEWLLKQCGDAFREVETAKATEKVAAAPKVHWEPPIGKRFNGKAGKWNGFAYLKKHGIGQTHGLKKRKLGDKVFGWELVPIALADVGLEHAPIPWNASQEGQEELNGHRDDRDDQRSEQGRSDDGDNAASL